MKYISLTLALVLLTLSSAHGTIVKSVSLAEMSKTADAIIQGIVDEQDVVERVAFSHFYDYEPSGDRRTQGQIGG